MKKKFLGLAGAAAALAAWCGWRNHRYPLVDEYPLFNKFFIPGNLLSHPFLNIANSRLASMKLPAPPQGIRRRERWVSTEDGEWIRLTIYQSEDLKKDIPCLVYFHGGGFCLGDAPYIHEIAAEYARKARCMVVFVHYRTSDRYPFPVPFQDCRTGLSYVRRHAEALHIDEKRIAVGGDSAGGALAAACALWEKEQGRQLCFQLLIYPVLDARMETESMKKYTDSPLWNARLTKKMWELYLKNGDMGMRRFASPLEAGDFQNLPPAYIEVEEFDCLHDEGVHFWEKLCQAEVPARLEDVKGTFHGFDVRKETMISRRMRRIRCEALYQAFWKSDTI